MTTAFCRRGFSIRCSTLSPPATKRASASLRRANVAAAAARRRSGAAALLRPALRSEWGLALVNAQWLIAQMPLPNVQICSDRSADHQRNVGMVAQAVGDCLCHTCLVIYPTGNLEGRYRRGSENSDDYAAAHANGRHPGAITAMPRLPIATSECDH